MQTTNSWIGLKSYQEGQTLYGRNKDILALSQCILNNPQTVVYGKSGIGKSSILEAGIFPLARKAGVFPVRIRLEHNAEPYNRQIFGQIFHALENLRKDNLDDKGERIVRYVKGTVIELVPVIDPERESLWEFFHRHEFFDENGARIIPMPVLDQFEEIFTLETDSNKINAFFTELADLLNSVVPDYVAEATDDYAQTKDVGMSETDENGLPEIDFLVEDSQYEKYLLSSDFHLVITLREDFLSYLERYTESIPCMKQNRYCLQPIDREQGLQIITRPIPGIVTQETAQTILSKVSGDGVKPGVAQGQLDSAILSLYLSRLYDKMQESGKDSFTDELVATFGDHIIRDFYEECIKGITPESVRYLEDALVNADGFRESIPVSNVYRDGIVTKDELILLKERHLIHDFPGGNGLPRIEFIHDKIAEVVREIKKNREVEEKNRELQAESLEFQKAAKASRRRFAALGVISLLIFGLSAFSIQRNAKLRQVNRELEQRKETILDLMIGNVANDLSNGDSYAAKRICLEALHSFHQNGTKIPDSFKSVLRIVASRNDAVLRGHSGSVTDVRFSPDSRFLATAGEDSTAVIWDVRNGKVVHEFKDAADFVLSVAFSPDGQYLATGSRDCTVRLYDVATGTLRWQVDGHKDWVRCVAFSPDGKSVISASKDKTLKVWNATDGKSVRTLTGHRDEVLHIAFSPDKSWMATSSADKDIRIWKTGDYSLEATLSGHGDWVRSVEFHPDNVHLVSASDDGTVRVWDIRSKSQRIFRRMPEYVTGALFSPDGKKVVTSSRDGLVGIWKADAAESFRPRGMHSGWVNAIAISPDGKRIASGSTDMTVRLIDLEPVLKEQTFPGHDANCSHIASLPSGDGVVSAGRDDRLFLWKTGNNDPLWEASDVPRISSLAVHPTNAVVYTGHLSGIETRSLKDGSLLPLTFENVSSWINTIDISPDGKLMAAGGANLHHAAIWDAGKGGAPLKILPTPVETGILTTRFSPDAKTLAIGGEDGSIWLWHVDSEADEPYMTIPAHGDAVFSISFSKDGTLLLSSGKDKYARVWDIKTGKCLKVFSGSSGLVNKALFSLDESEIVTMSSDHRLRIWNTATTLSVDEWTDPDGSLVLFDWTPDKRHLFTASWDGSLALWSYPTMEEIVEDLEGRFGGLL